MSENAPETAEIEGSPDPEAGLRERKKAATRQLIADTARELFAERGFEAVTVAEIARAAGVSEKTVFNYFRAKEDLFYSRLEAFEEEILEAVRERASGTSVVAAFGEFLLRERGIFGAKGPMSDSREATAQMRAVMRIITESPALLAREREIQSSYVRSLGALIAEETRAKPGDVRPYVAAGALIGLHRALIDYVRMRALDGDTAGEIAAGVRAETKRGLKLLEEGLGGYGAARSSSAKRG
jgi:AcrR family transcriptional regulator